MDYRLIRHLASFKIVAEELNPTYGSQNNPWTPKPHQPPNRMH